MASKKPERTKALDKFVTDAIYIQAEDAQTAGSIACVNRLLLMATLPHSRVSGKIYERKNGALTLRVLASRWGIPYGPKPRLITYWLSKEIVKTNSREIELGGSLSEFLRKLGLAKEGRVAKVVKEQTRRLFGAQIQIEKYESDRWQMYRMDMATRADYWWDSKNPDQAGLWGSRIKVGEDFFKECLRSSVPLDERALSALKGSSFDLDVYGWAAARLFTVRKPTLISWEQLQIQFGTGYPTTGQGRRNFKKRLGQRLKRVLLVYPGAKLWMDEKGKGLWLDESPPAVHKRIFHNPR